MVSASYLAGETDNTGKVVQYQYSKPIQKWPSPNIGQSNTRNHTASTIPTEPVNLEEIQKDIVPPVIKHKPVTTSQAYKEIVIEANVTDDKSVPSATLYFKRR